LGKKKGEELKDRNVGASILLPAGYQYGKGKKRRENDNLCLKRGE